MRLGRRTTLRAACALIVVAVMAACVAACGSGSKGSGHTTSAAKAPSTGTAQAASGTPATSASGATFASTFAGQPSSDWLSVGGSLMHENYSPLTQINTSNVSQLKGVWRKHLGTAKEPIYSAEGQALYDNGVLYISTGSSNVFAYQVSTGKLLWHYKPTPAIALSLSADVCCGWDNRAVGIGGGMVYIAQINSIVTALDQQTGKVVWQTPIAKATAGMTSTLPITYYDNKVYAGVSGGEYEIRGFMEALNAKTGHPLWKFSNTAGKGQPNGNTWAGSSAMRGGASTWNAPSVDPQTNTIFYSTSNASPDWDGRARAGKDLYTSSIMALDADTGALKWYYQEVHHDIWDYDAPSETVLFNPKIHGKVVPAIAEPGKTGMLYVLNRDTGKPLYPTPEKPVPQNKAQKTWPTQPASPLVFSPQKASHEQLSEVRAAAASTGKFAKKLKIKAGVNFDGNGVAVAPNKNVSVVPNGALGGDNWPPSSYDPSNNYYYVCSQQGAQVMAVPHKVPKPHPGKSIDDTDSVATVLAGANTPGLLTAFDMSTGEVAWQDHFPDSCYSGTVDTAGGVVFVGRNKGELQAYDANTGKLKWSFQTGAGANAPVTVFQQGGQEYVAEYAGGNEGVASPHGDNFWLFSLSGKLGPAKAGKAAKATHTH